MKWLWASILVCALFCSCGTPKQGTSTDVAMQLKDIKAEQLKLESAVTTIVNNALDAQRAGLEKAIATMQFRSNDRMWFAAISVGIGAFFVGVFIKIAEIKARLICLILGLSLVTVGLAGFFFFRG